MRTSSNFLIRKALSHADKNFWDSFDLLADGKATTVWLTLDTSYMERERVIIAFGDFLLMPGT